MALFLTPNETRLGSLNLLSTLPLPALPNIIAEWAAIIPLFCHLASHRDDYRTAGEVALNGKISIGLFPKLGTLSGLSRLLTSGQEFFDCASPRAGSTQIVWDVLWGGEFPCANGGAAASIVRDIRRRQRPSVISTPETLADKQSNSDVESEKYHSSTTSGNDIADIPASPSPSPTPTQSTLVPEPPKPPAPHTRRPQTLHVFRFRRKNPTPGSLRRTRLAGIARARPVRLILNVSLVAICAALILVGTYGSAAILACSIVTRLVTGNVTIRRTPGYLDNNESFADACMLVAPHQNSMDWQLFVGDRTVVDWILNKTMVVIPREEKAVKLAAVWLRVAHWLQIAAMTFTAAQKGWDGVVLVGLWALHGLWQLQRGVLWPGCARAWLEREGVEVEAKSFEFTGRIMMLGAIQKFSGSKVTSWMDSIVVPNARRETWLRALAGQLTENEALRLDPVELTRVRLSSLLAIEASKIIKQHIDTEVA